LIFSKVFLFFSRLIEETWCFEVMIREFPVVSGVSHRFIDVNDVRLHVAEAGCGDPLLLLQGWPQHWYQWRYLIPSIAGLQPNKANSSDAKSRAAD
jgi:hypothetical protein